jgi:hypothetical protein
MTKIQRQELAADKERRIQLALHQFRAGTRQQRIVNPEAMDAMEAELEKMMRGKP